MAESRKLAAILAADVVGYSRLAGSDEDRTLARLRALRSDLIDPTIAVHNGRVGKRTGDGALVEFRSVVDAVRCAVEIQNAMVERNAGVPAERGIEFRIGIHLGDVVEESDGDLMGDSVNIAARLEGIAQPGAICLSEDAYRQVRARLDLKVDDLGQTQLKNIVEPVRVYSLQVGLPAQAKAASPVEPEEKSAPRLALPDKPSIAALPFQNMSGDPEQYFADGMVEDIITALSRARWLFVVARNSSFTYKGKAVDIKQVGRELGVRYVLEGSVRKAAARLRITCQLIDALTGAHLWADRFDGSTEDVFELQDKVALGVAGVIEPALQEAEIRRSIARPTSSDLTAYDLYLRALPLMRGWGREPALQGLDLLREAIARDPNYGRALVGAAWCAGQLFAGGWAEDPETDRREALDLVRRAVKAAPDDPEVLVRAAGTLDVVGEDIGRSLAMLDRALTLNPSNAVGWFWSGFLRLFADRISSDAAAGTGSSRSHAARVLGLGSTTRGSCGPSDDSEQYHIKYRSCSSRLWTDYWRGREFHRVGGLVCPRPKFRSQAETSSLGSMLL
jgi:adenylate cyclase